jgi:putative serine protease PepD
VAFIQAQSAPQPPSAFNPFGGGGGGTATGSGFVIDGEGHILTNAHVIEGADKIEVTLGNTDNSEPVSAQVVGKDPSTDIALLKVDAPSDQLHPLPLGDSSQAQVGDPVVAIGSPFSLPETTTAGIVSAVGRSITAPNNYTIAGAIQTDAAINPGNSGGPLLDANGRVLGLNDQIQTNSGSSAGVGFAIPSSTVARIAGRIIAGQSIQHAYVGVELSANSTGGAQVSSVQPDSPASSAGLETNDLITSVNGKTITSTEQFIATVDNYAPGDTVKFTIKRGGETKNVSVKLGTRPRSTPTG